MGLTLAPELADLLGRAGGQWPQADEDRLKELSGTWRDLAGRLRAIADDTDGVSRRVGSEQYAGSVDAFGLRTAQMRSHAALGADAADQTVLAVTTMADATLTTKTSMVGGLERTHASIGQVKGAAIVGPVIGWLLRLLGRFLWRLFLGLLKLIWRGIVWLAKGIAWIFKKVVDFFKRLFEGDKKPDKKPEAPQKPVYRKDQPLPHARDLIKNGREYKGTGSGRGKNNLPSRSDPNSVLYTRDPQTGKIRSYVVYDDKGNAIKRVDLEGRAHNGIDTPHTSTYKHNTNPQTGETHVREDPRSVRPATPEEIP